MPVWVCDALFVAGRRGRVHVSVGATALGGSEGVGATRVLPTLVLLTQLP